MKNVWDSICSGVKLIFNFLLYKPFELLKSGMLLSVETPAPPKNTILELLSTIFFNSSIFLSNNNISL